MVPALAHLLCVMEAGQKGLPLPPPQSTELQSHHTPSLALGVLKALTFQVCTIARGEFMCSYSIPGRVKGQIFWGTTQQEALLQRPHRCFIFIYLFAFLFLERHLQDLQRPKNITSSFQQKPEMIYLGFLEASAAFCGPGKPHVPSPTLKRPKNIIFGFWQKSWKWGLQMQPVGGYIGGDTFCCLGPGRHWGQDCK